MHSFKLMDYSTLMCIMLYVQITINNNITYTGYICGANMHYNNHVVNGIRFYIVSQKSSHL